MKFLGHPVHLMVVHFPSALLPMELVCYGLYYFSHNTSFALASFYAMAGGVIIGWVAVLTGAIDLMKIPPEKEKAQTQAFMHGGLQTTVLIVYSVFLFTAWKKYPGVQEPALLPLTGKLILIIVMFTANYLGGNLLLKYKVGIEN